MKEDIAVVDFQKLSEQEEFKKLLEACEKYGTFRIINHPISTPLMSDMKMVAKYLHDLPTEIKSRNQSAVPESGYRSSTTTNPLYENLAIYDLYSSPQAIDDFCTQLNVPPNYSQIIAAYGRGIHSLASTISQKLADHLGVVGADFKDWPFLFRIIKYKFSEETMGNLAARNHSDMGFITILQDDETVSGLEMMDDSGSFTPVPPKPGAFLCIIGDTGHVWSNGRFQNMKHRVICKQPTTCYSLGGYMFSARDGIVDIPKELVDSDHPRLYRPFKYDDLRESRIKTEMRAGQFIDQFRIAY